MLGFNHALLCRIPGVVDGEYAFRSDLGGFLVGQLAAPGSAFFRVCSGSRVVVFGVACRLLVGGFAPVVPSFGHDVAAQLAVHEEGVAVGTPGTAQTNAGDARRCDEFAMVEHVAEGNVFGRGGGGHVGIALAADGTPLEPCRRRTEDEVGGTLDVAIGKIEARTGHAGVDGVLIAQDAAVDELQAVAFGMQGHGLSALCGIVFDGEKTDFNLKRDRKRDLPSDWLCHKASPC